MKQVPILCVAMIVIVLLWLVLLFTALGATEADSLEKCEFISESHSVHGNVRHIKVRCDEEDISFGQFFDYIEESDSFTLKFQALLREYSESGVFFECPALRDVTLYRTTLLFVLIPGDGDTFTSIEADERSVVGFRNLGGDAILTAPCPRGGAPEGSPLKYAPQVMDNSAYAHLTSFARYAPAQQFLALWRLCVAQIREEMNELTRRGSDQRLWLSTHGKGVSWLHVRVEYRPKYYHHRAFKGEGL